VQAYKHVGITFAINRVVAMDVVRKAVAMRATCRPLDKAVIANSALPLEIRKSLALSLILSRGSYGIGTWPALFARDITRFSHSVMTTYRARAGKPRWKKVQGASDAEIVAELKLPSPARLVSIARIKLFSRIVKKGFWHALAMVEAGRHARGSWFSALALDFKWLFEVNDKCHSLIGSTPSQWADTVRNAPSFFVKRAICMA
jgi:hypothetical protein